MYKRKLFIFGLTTVIILMIALVCTAITAHLTRTNLKQATIAQTLLIEHQQLSSISYRLFKQLTDEVIFGQNANQSEVRKKQEMIALSFNNIRRLELQQREALGLDQTFGSVEDTDGLEALIQEVIASFREVIQIEQQMPLAEREQFRDLLEITIDNQFREAINSAVARQSRVVAAINTRIDTLNTIVVWFTIGMATISLPLIAYGCYWLFNQLYQPIELLKEATNNIADGKYNKPIAIKLDEEFDELSSAINELAKRLESKEKQVDESQKKLEFEVEQRTHQLTIANHKLTKIDARRRQFISDVSHELRTPLTIIRGESQVTLRLKAAEGDDYKEALKVILEQSILLSRLVDDLLTLTRAEMDTLKLSKEPSNLKRFLEAEIAKWQRLKHERSFSLQCASETELEGIYFDKTRIQQVLAILLDNACKYSADDQPVSISVETNDAFVFVKIEDRGEGIAASELENIFERFVRFSKHKEGLGLGLPIAKVIVESHGGELSVSSELHQGAAFTFSLPKEH